MGEHVRRVEWGHEALERFINAPVVAQGPQKFSQMLGQARNAQGGTQFERDAITVLEVPQTPSVVPQRPCVRNDEVVGLLNAG